MFEVSAYIHLLIDTLTGRGSPKWVYRPRGVPHHVIAWMKQTIADSLTENEPVRVSWMQRAIWEAHALRITRHMMYRILRKVLKAQYGTSTILIKDNFDPDSAEAKTKRQKFLIEYAKALQLQERGEAIIVSYDETYINTGHAAAMTWFTVGAKRRVGGKGKRLIVLHALTKDGPVVVIDDETGERVELTEAQNADLSTPYLTAEMIYEARKAEGDYHDNMDSPTYLKWLEFRLFPTLRKLYPGKRIIAIKDNASYHKAHPPMTDGTPWRSISSLKNKKEMVKLCDLWDIKDITVRRPPDGVSMRASEAKIVQAIAEGKQWRDVKLDRKLFLERSPKGPSVEELRAVLKARSREHPEYFETLADRKFREFSLQDSGSLTIFLTSFLLFFNFGHRYCVCTQHNAPHSP